MSIPRRLVDDPEADFALREVLRQAPRSRSLDVTTRRRLGAKVARASALPAVAAGWLFVKSAAAALVVVVGTGSALVATGVLSVHQTSTPAPLPAPVAVRKRPLVLEPPRAIASTVPEPPVRPAPRSSAAAGVVPSAASVASAGATLAAEAALLERARAVVRSDPALALAIADEHRARYPQAQLTSERLLIQIEALHRLHRDAEARALAGRLLGGARTGLYAERVEALLGEKSAP